MADGYARASGKVGVAHRDVGPGRDQPRHRHRHRDARFGRRWSASPGRCRSTLLGTDAFQETDITGVTLPITKHNYLVTRVEDIAPTHARGVLRRALGPARAGAGRHHQGRAAGELRADVGADAPVRLPGYRPEHARAPSDLERARAS